MLFHAFITFFMLLRTKSRGVRYVYGGLLFLFIYLLIQTATRGTILGFFVGAFVMVVYIALNAKEYPKVRNIAAGGIIALVVVVVGFVAVKNSNFVQHNPYLQRIASISLGEMKNRFNIWGMAFEGVKERPLLGWGQSNYNYVFNKYYRPELHGGEAWFDRVHDIVMDWLIAGGVLGLVAYFSIYFSALYYLIVRPLIRKDDTAFTVIERGVLIGILVGYLIHNIVVFDNIVSYIFYGTMLAFIHARVSKPIDGFATKKIDVRIVDQVIAPVVAILMCVIVYYVNVPGIQAASDVIEAFKSKDPEKMLTWFNTALSHNSFGNQEIREQMTQKVQGLIQSKDASEKIKQKAFKRVEEELLKQVQEKPGDARIHVFLASYYRSTNNLDTALKQIEIARELSPQKQLILYEEGYIYLQKQEYAKAEEVFKEAYELGPQFDDATVNYVMAAIYNGQLGLVDELIKTDAQKNAFARSDIAIQAAYQAKMYPLLIDMFHRQITLKPDDTQARTNLAFILNETGDTAQAVEVLTQAGKDIPSFKEQADKFISSVVTQSKINKNTKTPKTVEINGQTVPVNVGGE